MRNSNKSSILIGYYEFITVFELLLNKSLQKDYPHSLNKVPHLMAIFSRRHSFLCVFRRWRKMPYARLQCYTKQRTVRQPMNI